MSKSTFSWVSPNLEVRDTGRYGKGLFAIKEIKKHELLVVFGGYAMTLDEFFELPPNVMQYSSQIDDEMVFGIKTTKELDDSYYINHSCDPNAGFGGQIFIRAMRIIQKDEEVTYDYGMELSPSKTLNPVGIDRFDSMECECGAKGCRRKITEHDWEIPELQIKYDGYFQWYIQNRIDQLRKRA